MRVTVKPYSMRAGLRHDTLEARTPSGCTAAHAACKFGRVDCCRALYRLGADFTVPDVRGMSPANYATLHKKTEVLALLASIALTAEMAKEFPPSASAPTRMPLGMSSEAQASVDGPLQQGGGRRARNGGRPLPAKLRTGTPFGRPTPTATPSQVLGDRMAGASVIAQSGLRALNRTGSGRPSTWGR